VKNCILSFFFLIYCFGLSAQSKRDSVKLKNELDSLNRQIDHWVVQKNLGLLQNHYADDFVFTHGTGHVDSKASWLKAVADTNVQYASRIHDSTGVELHEKLAVVTGTLTVQRKASGNINRYAVRYVRIYVRQQKTWQMVSHRTVLEWHI
jgi:hypothetical protein